MIGISDAFNPSIQKSDSAPRRKQSGERVPAASTYSATDMPIPAGAAILAAGSTAA